MPKLEEGTHPFNGRPCYRDEYGVWRYSDDGLPLLGPHLAKKMQRPPETLAQAKKRLGIKEED